MKIARVSAKSGKSGKYQGILLLPKNIREKSGKKEKKLEIREKSGKFFSFCLLLCRNIIKDCF